MAKSIILMSVLLGVCLLFFACGQSKTDLHSTPENAVQAIFDAAKNQDFGLLTTLCDPLKENDGDTDCLCALSEDYVPHKCASDSHNRVTKAEFTKYFQMGKINGEVEIAGDEASVPIVFGPDGTQTETMNLVQRDGKWYLSSF
jgi:hypothetical protein